MGFWDSLKKIASDIAETPGYWYDQGKKTGLEGGLSAKLFRDVHCGVLIDDLPEELRDAYRRGYEDGVREREEQ
jgi:hypothetical protein